MTEAKRTRLTPQARREQLIEHGIGLLADTPLEQLTIEAVADSVGVSRALLFHYFESKQDYVLELAQEQSRRLLACTEPDVTADDPMAMLRESMSAFIDYVDRNRNAYVGLLRGPLGAERPMQEVFAQTREVMARRVLDRAPDLGLEPTDLMVLSVYGWLAMVEEVTVAWIAGTQQVTRTELLDLITASLPLLALAATRD
ncbi:TetR/AcrR family transcriptional regulator [Williamsia sp. CHRR-6]|uniref:TetR/AcrR family transcriptional regulator n=1 Tax=Williamsia sp. CHRR-6 TaxID=2835871 RepID=UPI001BDADB09|nr:TetR family transcriptional regulator [Williamsia sp. CHRR-6]MBT0568451.1 TetR family transcriptional regulator [Williamsia sp. CHRR-6]